MKIKRIYFGDFGVFQNQTMEKIGKGIVVIGGSNRAGKTTLMNGLRCLGFGIPESGIFPPAQSQYEIKCNVSHSNYMYSIFIAGHGKPKVRPIGDVPEVAIEELYNSLDRFTYSQIFTLSLDELRQIPEGLSNRDEDKLTAVLLGAGWSESLTLLKLRDTLSSEAEAIGGKSGKISVKQFKPYHSQLLSGIKKRDEANKQLNDYNLKRQKHENITEKRIPECRDNIERIQAEVQRLELVSKHFLRYKRFKTLQSELYLPQNKKMLDQYPHGGLIEAQRLKTEYEDVVSKYKVVETEFSTTTGRSAGDKFSGELMEYAEILEEYSILSSGWKERLRNFKTQEAETLERSQNLKYDLKELFVKWQDKDASILESIIVDQVKMQDLKQQVKLYSELKFEHAKKKQNLADLKAYIEEKEQQKENLPTAKRNLINIVKMAVGLDVLLIISLSFVVAPAVAVTIGITVGIGILAYFLNENSTNQRKEMILFDLNKDLENARRDYEIELKRKEEIQINLDMVSDEITDLKGASFIPEEIQVELLPDFISRIRDLKREYKKIEGDKTKLNDEEKRLQKEISLVKNVLASLEILKEDVEDIIAESDSILIRLDKATGFLKQAKALEAARQSKAKTENGITALTMNREVFETRDYSIMSYPVILGDFIKMGQGYEDLINKQSDCESLHQILEADLSLDKWRPMLLGDREDLGDDSKAALQNAFEEWCNEFGSEDEIKQNLTDLKQEFGEMSTSIKRLEEEKRDLERDLRDLGTDKKLIEAKEEIDKAMDFLEPLAEDYAVRKVASLMLNKVYQKLLENTKNQLLSPASHIFSRITNSYYKNIEPPEGSGSVFIAKLADESEQVVNTLSRATKEQLFLSVRLSRILEIKPELPVIFDDTFANFDPVHIKQAVSFISELSKTHQVFVLTCHPELMECLETSTNSEIQFWGLKEGRFKGPYVTCSKVKDLLIK